MEPLLGVNWQRIFVPDLPVLEILVRGSITYLAIFFLLRFVGVRQVGSLGVADVLVIVLISDAAQNAMAGQYNSLSDGLLLVAVIVGWSLVLDWLAYRFEWASRLLTPAPTLLMRDGRLLWRNMRRELVSREELMSQLRLQGVEDPSEVKSARMESDGRISIVKHEGHDTPKNEKRRGP